MNTESNPDNNSLLNAALSEKYKGVYEIQMHLQGAGFGAMLLQTLNQIRYCERHQLLPIVNYTARCKSHYYDENYGTNMWHQFFEPLIPPFDSDCIAEIGNDPNSSFTLEDLYNLEDTEMLHICEHHPDSIYSYTFAEWRDNPPKDIEKWYRQQRKKGHETYSQYIRVKAHVENKVEQFKLQHFNGHQILGLHIRGTDLMYAPPVAPSEYFYHVDKWLNEQSNPIIFVATDQAQFLTVFKERYGSLVVAYDSARSDNDVVPFNLKDVSPYKKGEDVLIDLLLLSNSHFLIKGASAVGELALYINPKLPSLDLAVNKRFAFGQDYGKGWNGGLNHQTKPAWQLLKNRNLLSENSNRNSQTLLQKFQYGMRPYYSPLVMFIQRAIRYLFKKLKAW